MSYAVRVVYPVRRGKKSKRDLVVTKPTRQAAITYAKQVAGRGKRYAIPAPGKILYTTGKNNPTACVYSLKSWDTKPVCFTFKWVPTKTRETSGYQRVKDFGKRKPVLKAATVVQVPYTMLNGR